MMLAGMPSVDICSQLSINPKTLWRWRQREDFRQALNELSEQATNDALTTLKLGYQQALDALMTRITDPVESGTVVVSAARAWLQYGTQYEESVDFAVRIAELEKRAGLE